MKPTKTPKERKRHMLNNVYLFLLAIAALTLTVLAVIGRPKPAVIKTPMPTVDDSIVNREYEPLKTLE